MSLNASGVDPRLAAARNLQSYPWYTSDWRKDQDVIAMSPEQRGVFRDLLDMCWEQGDLPVDQAALRKLAMCEPNEWKRAWPVVSRKFFEVDGRLHNRKVDAKRPEIIQAKEDRRRGAERTNEVRWACRSAIAERVAETSLSESLSESLSDRSPSRSPSRYAGARLPSSTSTSTTSGEGVSVGSEEPPAQTPAPLSASNEKLPDDTAERIRQIADAYPSSEGYEQGNKALMQRFVSSAHPLRELNALELYAPFWIEAIKAGTAKLKPWNYFAIDADWLRMPKQPAARNGHRDPMEGVDEILRKRGYK